MSAVRLSYLDTEFGQLHARTAGEGEPVVLLHLTPGSGAQFDHILPALAAQGYQAWALDALGNGRSAPLPPGYSFELAAAALGQAIDQANLNSIKLVGGHMTAQMAVELVVTRPQLATHLVIDGLPLWDRETRERIIGLFDNSAPDPDEAGGHVMEAWRRSLNLHRAWNPELTLDGSGNRRVIQALVDSLQQGLDMELGAHAFLNYNVHPQLAKLSLPTLVTAATGDTLFDQHEATLGAIPGAQSHEFAGTHPRHVDSRAEEYVRVLVDFFRFEPDSP
ncbi:MAG: alpha/beta fold hydrolase [Pseudomonadota bacterium]